MRRKQNQGTTVNKMLYTVLFITAIFTTFCLSIKAHENKASSYTLNIISDDVTDKEFTSAYTAHKFKIAETNVSIQNPTWSLTLPLTNGEAQVITLKDEELSCTTPSITNFEKYKINKDGNIEGILNFSGVSDNNEINAVPLKVYFELKPFIEYAKIEKVENNTYNESYDAYYEVKYWGTDKIQVSVEEEFSSKLRSWYITDQPIANGIVDNITAPYYAWIDFTAENQYGKSVYTIELQPYGIVTDPGESSIKSYDKIKNGTFDIYSVDGIKTATIKDLSEVNKLSHKGIIFIKQIRNGKVVRSFKLINR